ncbi:putative uncharacterized protein [Rhodococcus sp. AW25M09]|nr:putative uncharacterized protein [Rhodococcus sp. AW25M09]
MFTDKPSSCLRCAQARRKPYSGCEPAYVRNAALRAASGSAGVSAIGVRAYVERASPTALHASRFDRLMVFTSTSTARRLAAGLRIFQCYLPQCILLQLGLGEQPFELAVLLAKLL